MPKKRGRDLVEARCTVKCCGKDHEILLTRKGRICLLGHPHLEADKLMREMGVSMRCFRVKEEFLRAVRGYAKWVVNKAYFPQELRLAAEQASERHEDRTAHYDINRPKWAPTQKQTYAQHFDIRMRELLDESLGQCHYKMPVATRVVICRNVHILPTPVGGEPRTPEDFLKVEYERQWHRRPEYHFIVQVHRDWWRTVYNKGMAVIDGCFVLRDLGNGRVLAGRPAKGNSVFARSEVAEVVDGKLRWVEPYTPMGRFVKPAVRRPKPWRRKPAGWAGLWPAGG